MKVLQALGIASIAGITGMGVYLYKTDSEVRTQILNAVQSVKELYKEIEKMYSQKQEQNNRQIILNRRWTEEQWNSLAI